METPKFDEFLRSVEKQINEAYQRGWHDAVAAIVAAAQSDSVAPPSNVAADILAEPADEDSKPVIDVIFDVINELPGLRGAEIFREAVKRVPGSEFKKMDRTGRTALARLKDRGRIFQRSKKWYPKKGVDENV